MLNVYNKKKAIKIILNNFCLYTREHYLYFVLFFVFNIFVCFSIIIGTVGATLFNHTNLEHGKAQRMETNKRKSVQ